MATHSSTLAWKIPWTEKPGRLQSMGSWRVGHDWALHFHFSLSSLEKAMATHSSVLAWRIPGTEKPGGLPSLGSHRVGHDWSNLAEQQHTHSSLQRQPNSPLLLIILVFTILTLNSMLVVSFSHNLSISHLGRRRCSSLLPCPHHTLNN